MAEGLLLETFKELENNPHNHRQYIKFTNASIFHCDENGETLYSKEDELTKKNEDGRKRETYRHRLAVYEEELAKYNASPNKCVDCTFDNPVNETFLFSRLYHKFTCTKRPPSKPYEGSCGHSGPAGPIREACYGNYTTDECFYYNTIVTTNEVYDKLKNDISGVFTLTLAPLCKNDPIMELDIAKLFNMRIATINYHGKNLKKVKEILVNAYNSYYNPIDVYDHITKMVERDNNKYQISYYKSLFELIMKVKYYNSPHYKHYRSIISNMLSIDAKMFAENIDKLTIYAVEFINYGPVSDLLKASKSYDSLYNEIVNSDKYKLLIKTDANYKIV